MKNVVLAFMIAVVGHVSDATPFSVKIVEEVPVPNSDGITIPLTSKKTSIVNNALVKVSADSEFVVIKCIGDDKEVQTDSNLRGRSPILLFPGSKMIFGTVVHGEKPQSQYTVSCYDWEKDAFPSK